MHSIIPFMAVVKYNAHSMRVMEHIIIHSEINGWQNEIFNNLSIFYKCMRGFVCRVHILFRMVKSILI